METKKQEEEPKKSDAKIFSLRTTANREDQVMDFVSANAEKKGYNIYSIIRPHGMRGYIFLEAGSKQDAEEASFNIPYARGVLPKEIDYKEIEHMLEMVKVEKNIQKNDIVEIISGPFKREKAKITRIDKVKEEVVVELLEAAVPIPITVKMDSVKVIRREKEEKEEEEKKEEKPVTIPSPESKETPVEFAGEETDEIPMPGTDKSESEDKGSSLGLKIKVKSDKKSEDSEEKAKELKEKTEKLEKELKEKEDQEE